jgi:phosphohistidine phosphatase SixA
MKVIELRRHATRAKDADALSPEGLDLARRVAPSLRGGYTTFVSSGAERATQTLLELWPPASGAIDVESGLQSPVEDRWRAAGKAAGSSHLERIRAQDPELVERESQRLAGVVRAMAASAADGIRVLAVGHTPLIEAAILGLTGSTLEPLGECEGAALTFEGDRVTTVEELRL